MEEVRLLPAFSLVHQICGLCLRTPGEVGTLTMLHSGNVGMKAESSSHPPALSGL